MNKDRYSLYYSGGKAVLQEGKYMPHSSGGGSHSSGSHSGNSGHKESARHLKHRGIV